MGESVYKEIESYFLHKDYPLAKRRFLDAAFDTNDLRIIETASKQAKLFRKKEVNLLDFVAIIKEIDNIDIAEKLNETNFISATNISKTYTSGNFKLLPATFNIKGNEVFGLVGENGNGKTTLLRCLSGELVFEQGNLIYNNLNPRDYYHLKSEIAFIPQRIPRWYGNLKDNLHFSASIAGIKNKENEVIVDFMLERFDLEKFASLNWDQISSGYKTRFEIARILLKKPKLLFLDEPLANLDINAQQTLLNDLKLLAKSKRNPLAIVLSSQQLFEVEKIADAVLFIKDGKCIVEDKTSNLALKNALFSIELETPNLREEIINALHPLNVEIKYNGTNYVITSNNVDTQIVVGKLLEKKIKINYFRDITLSTKRFF